MAHVRITADSDIPLVGSLYFGIIDRGTSLLQVRPSCGCNLNCPFCSVDAGPCSTTRATSYEVDLEYLLSAVEEIAPFKGTGVECHIDSPGEPLMYPRLPELVAALKNIDAVSIVSLQTNGTLLDEKKIAALAKAGLDRVNLSLHALEPALARQLAGVDWYDIDKVCGAAKAVVASSMDLLIAPVFMPGINDAEIPKLIGFAQECGAGKRFPPLGIQKFERYKYGRTPKGVKVQELVAVFQPEHQGVGEIVRPAPPPRCRAGLWYRAAALAPAGIYQRRESDGRDKGSGWIHGEQLGVARNRVVSVFGCDKESGQVRVKIVAAKNNIYVGVPV